MFRLKKLEIHGFKSFVDKTSLTLPSRITAIVGPNGSGKSNICDAVQWVLGEQSARVLRGTTMEDVIFNGSARRKPLGIAEVSLTLESRGGTHWAETGGEVVITRKVARDGESDYILNGKRARLKDVQDLLLGTGLGVRAYSIIEQQKIDLILSTKPQDRRRLIEEAAGISKYKMRKRQAEVKLEETRANLLRLTDIVSEIERNCTSLKRQAGRAAKWKEQADRLAEVKRLLLRLKSDQLSVALAESEAQLRAAIDAEAHALSESGRLDAAQEEARRVLDEAERVRREKSEALARARETLLSAEARVAAAEREAEESLARQELVESQRKDAEADNLRSAEEAARIGVVRETLEAELVAAEGEARQAAQALAEAARSEEEYTRLRETARRDLLAAAAKTSEATNREREASILVDRLGFALSKLEERSARAAEALALREQAERDALVQEETAAAALEEARRRLEEAGLSRRAADERLATLKSNRDAERARFHALDKRIGALETTLAERETGGDAARRALAASGAHPNGVLADHFESREGFETALDAALGAALEAPVLKDRAALDAVLLAVHERRLGTARFILPIPDTPFPLKPHDERVLGVARELLTPHSGDEALAASLPDAIVVETLDDALALAPLHPERAIATRDGIVLRGATVEAAGTEVPGEGLFTVRRDLKRNEAEREALRQSLTALDEEIDGTAQTASELGSTIETETAALRAKERDHSASRARVATARDERARAEREVVVLKEEGVSLESDLVRVGEDRSEATRLAARRGEEMRVVETRIADLEAALETARGNRLSAAEADSAARNARDLLRERLRSAASAHETHRARAEGAARRLAESHDALKELAGRRERALEAGGTARKERADAASAAASADGDRAAADLAFEETHRTLEENEAASHAAREALDASRRTRFESELGVERKKADRDHLVETCQAEFSCLPEELPPVEGTAAALADDEASGTSSAAAKGKPLDMEALANEAAERTRTLEKLGPVNHAALEEYEVESKRFHELSTQKLDLELSLSQIKETIATINTTSSERFQEAFTAINANFAQVFQRLFRGGSASMHLLDDTDPLESGLEIMAQPPGKRNQTIGLLSGGEKALTAVALLVSIFRYKPSPFCILDEVDAPLDEANIDRFTSLLHELSDETQFVLITHSKRTMEAAQALYGVTQEEPGVSKVVSVRFD